MMGKYQELRDALSQNPTPGPWVCDWPPDSKTSEGEYADVSVWAGKAFDGQFINNIAFDNTIANGNYIAAANPEAIRALLAERDALREALSELVACKDIKRRIAIEQATMIPETDDEFAELDRLMADYAQRQPKAWCAAHAALAQEQGGSDASDPG